MSTPSPRRRWSAWACVFLLLWTHASAADTPKIKFDLPAGEAEPALKLFSDQSGQQVIFLSDVVQGIRTNAVRGEFTAEAALDRMIDGTDLIAVRDEATRAYALKRRTQGPKAPGAAVEPVSGRPESRKSDAADLVRLNPFEVKSEKDNSYGALNSNSIARFNTELEKTPVVADIFTSQFIDDVGAQSLQDLFLGYGVGAGMTMATPSSDSQKNQPGDRYTTSEFGIRGVSAGTPRLDGFDFSPTNTNATALFDIERVDVLHGSQGLLYGSTGPGGLINLVSKQARFGLTSMDLSERIDQYGSKPSWWT